MRDRGHLLTALTLSAALVLLMVGGCGGNAAPEAATSAQVETAAATTEEAAAPSDDSRTRARVASVIDGDTIELRNGKRVRLVQIDAPEPREDECYGRESSALLAEILPRGARITLEADPNLDQVDRNGRLLRYVFKGDENVNLLLLSRGAASVLFFEGERGRYARALLQATRRAKSAGRGLWAACPGTRLTPATAIETGPSSPSTQPEAEPSPS